MQIEQIYTNVSKGQIANKKQLQKAFGDMSKADILLEVRHIRALVDWKLIPQIDRF